MKPFRVKYLEYIKSEPIQTEHGTSYHVDFAEYEGAQKVGFWEKFAQRDFGIGANVGAFIGTIGLWNSAALVGGGLALTPAVALAYAPIALGLVVAGAAIGGVSDYVRNTRQMEEGLNINPPSYFNRDMILNSLSVSTTVGMFAGIGMMGLAAINLGVAAPIAMAVNIATLVGGMIYGGVEGGKEGYQRMKSEYEAAEKKYKDPSYKVSLLQNRETQFDEIISNEASIAATILPMIVPALAQTETPSTKVGAGRTHSAPAAPTHNLSGAREFV